MSARLAVLAAGGTGGHLFPAQALGEELLRRGWRVALATDERGMRYAEGFPEAVARRALRAGAVARGGWRSRLAAPFALWSGVAEATSWFRQERPDVVVGFGGYPSAPAMAAAKRLGAPRMIHEQNGVLGRANRLFARGAAAIACGFPDPERTPQGARLVLTGNPVRDAAARLAGAPYAPPEEGGALRLLVFGGSQGARALSERVPAALALLPEGLRARLRVVAQTREPELEQTRARYAAAGVAVETAPFFPDMPERIAAAHLVIARAGASTCAELTVIGRPALLVPLPSAANDHQTANARALERAGAAILAPQDVLTPEALSANLEALLTDPARLSRMAAGAAAAGTPDAAARLADLVAEVAQQSDKKEERITP